MTVPSDVLRTALDDAGKDLLFDGTVIGDDVDVAYEGGSGELDIDTGVPLGDVVTGHPTGQIQFIQMILQAHDEKDDKFDSMTGTGLLGYPGNGITLPNTIQEIHFDLGEGFDGAFPLNNFLALANGNLGIRINGDGDVNVKLRVAVAPLLNIANDPFCFVAGTAVLTAEGPVAIEMLKVGDEVVSYDLANRERVSGRVVGTRSRAAQALYQLHAAGTVLEVTAEHPFYVPSAGKWVPVARLEAGYELLQADGKPALIDSIEPLPAPATVYNITVEGHHNYHVGEHGLLVHNK